MKKGVLKNFVKSMGKHLCQSLLLHKVAGLRSATFSKKRLWHRCFPVNFTKFLKTPFAQNTSGRLLLWATASKTLNTRVKIKRRSKVQEKIMSCEEKIMSCQWKTFSKNYKPVRVWLWLVYKLTKNYQISDFSSRYSN